MWRVFKLCWQRYNKERWRTSRECQNSHGLLHGREHFESLKSALNMHISGRWLMSWFRTCQNGISKTNLLNSHPNHLNIVYTNLSEWGMVQNDMCNFDILFVKLSPTLSDSTDYVWLLQYRLLCEEWYHLFYW